MNNSRLKKSVKGLTWSVIGAVLGFTVGISALVRVLTSSNLANPRETTTAALLFLAIGVAGTVLMILHIADIFAGRIAAECLMQLETDGQETANAPGTEGDQSPEAT